MKIRSYSKPKRLVRRGKLTSTYFSRVYDRATGHDTWASTGCKTSKAASEWVQSRELEEALGPERARARKTFEMSFSQAAETWIEEKKEKVSPGRYAVYRYQSEYWSRFFGARRLSEILSDDVRLYLRKRRSGVFAVGKNRKTKSALSATTLNEDLASLRNLFNFCVRNDWILRNPAAGVEKYRGEIRRRVRQLTEKEEAELLHYSVEPCEVEVNAKRNLGGRRGGAVSKEKRTFKVTYTPPPYLRPLVLTALRSGFRRRTLLSIRWCDVDLETGMWDIPGEFFKTAIAYRQPVAPSVIDALKNWRRHLLEKHGPKQVTLDQPIFGFQPDSSFKRAFQQAVRRAGLQGLTFHSLRACFLNRLRERGVPLDAAMELTGHQSLEVVLRHYRAVPAKDVQHAVAALDNGNKLEIASETDGKLG